MPTCIGDFTDFYQDISSDNASSAHMEGVYRDSYVRLLVHPKTQHLKSLFGADIMANRLNI